MPVRIALADRDFEDWSYASAETLHLGLDEHERGQRGLHAIKQALRPAPRTEPVWQPRPASRMHLTIARPRSTSLGRCLERFDELRSHLPPAP